MGYFLEMIIQGLLSLASWLIIASAILSWLVAFQVINLRNPVARQIVDGLNAVTRPILRPFQKVIPAIGGVDISPVIVLIIIWAAQSALSRYHPLMALIGS
jgi:YggT family protein